MELYDVHCHLLTDEYKAQLRQDGLETADGFPLPDWSVEEQIRFMDETGIAYSLLSLSSPHPYVGDAESCARVIRQLNEAAAEARDRYPDRLGFCAALPVPDGEAALAECAYAFDTLGAAGVKLPSNAAGQYLGDPALETLFAELDRREALILIHPNRPVPLAQNVYSAGPVPLYEFLADTTRAVVNLIAANVPLRYPHVRIVVPHAGSFLPAIARRFETIQPILVRTGMQEEPIDVRANLDKLYFDLAGSPTVEMMKLLLSCTDRSRLFYGSDFPFTPAAVIRQDLQRMTEEFGADPELAEIVPDVFETNARTLLRR